VQQARQGLGRCRAEAVVPDVKHLD
jgi:hypothetical protein